LSCPAGASSQPSLRCGVAKPGAGRRPLRPPHRAPPALRAAAAPSAQVLARALPCRRACVGCCRRGAAAGRGRAGKWGKGGRRRAGRRPLCARRAPPTRPPPPPTTRRTAAGLRPCWAAPVGGQRAQRGRGKAVRHSSGSRPASAAPRGSAPAAPPPRARPVLPRFAAAAAPPAPPPLARP
jgi:hypothetical protein